MPPSVLISPSPLKALRERGTKGGGFPYPHLSKGNASIANPPNFPRSPGNDNSVSFPVHHIDWRTDYFLILAYPFVLRYGRAQVHHACPCR